MKILKLKKLYFAFFLLCFIASAFATQTLGVTNIPAVAGNPQTINWTYSDSTNNQTQTFNLYYSGAMGQRNNFIASLDTNACSYNSSYGWLDLNTAGIADISTVSRSLVAYNGELFYLTTSIAGGLQAKTYNPNTDSFSNIPQMANGWDANGRNNAERL